jgi:uncharacterized protein RhaS with RHS repeats
MKWLTPDPIGERGGANLTAFCSGDPINNVDPLGLDPEFRAGLGLTLSLESGMRLVWKLTAVLSVRLSWTMIGGPRRILRRTCTAEA